jgi:hypothetical protein
MNSAHPSRNPIPADFMVSYSTSKVLGCLPNSPSRFISGNAEQLMNSHADLHLHQRNVTCTMLPFGTGFYNALGGMILSSVLYYEH